MAIILTYVTVFGYD